MFRRLVPPLALVAAACAEAPTRSDPAPNFAIAPAASFTAVDLGLIPGMAHSIANDIRVDHKVVVGASYLTAPLTDGRPVAWTVTAGAPVLHDLGLPAGATAAEARGINASGTIVGAYRDATTIQAWSYTRTGGFVTLPLPPGGVSAQASDINDAGEIVGTFHDGIGNRAFRYTSAGGYVNLHPALTFESRAEGINNNGMVVGSVTTLPPALEIHAVGWDAASTITDFGGMGTPARGFAWDINDRDFLVGRMDIQGYAMPFGGGTTFLPDMAEARGISERNRIAGSSAPPNSNAASRKGRYGALSLLPHLPGAVAAVSERVSRCGHIAGWSGFTDGTRRATVWRIAVCD